MCAMTSLLNGLDLVLDSGEVKRLSCHPLVDVHYVITCGFKVCSGVVGGGDEDLCVYEQHHILVIHNKRYYEPLRTKVG